MYRPFCVQDNSFRHNHNLLIYTSCIYSLQSTPNRQQKQTKRVGQGRGVCHPFAKNSWQLPYPCFCLISLASTTDKLIFESRVLVVYLTSAVALCLPPVLLCLYPSRLARESYLVILVLTDTYHCLNRQTVAHSLYLANYRLSKLSRYAETFISSQYRLTYHTIKQAIMHSKIATSSKA